MRTGTYKANRDNNCSSNKTILQAEEYKSFQAANPRWFKGSVVCEPHLSVLCGEIKYNLNACCCCYSTQTDEKKEITCLQHFITGFCNCQLYCCWHGLDNLIYQSVLDLYTSVFKMHSNKNSITILNSMFFKNQKHLKYIKIFSFSH